MTAERRPTLTASHSEHEATKTWSGKSCLHSILHNKRTWAAQGGRIILGPWNPFKGFFILFRPRKEADKIPNIGRILFFVLADNKKPPLCFNGVVWNMLSAYISCVCLPQHRSKLVSVSADGDTRADRSVYMHPRMTLCLRPAWQVETETCFRWPTCYSVAPQGDVLRCRTADVVLEHSSRPIPWATA